VPILTKIPKIDLWFLWQVKIFAQGLCEMSLKSVNDILSLPEIQILLHQQPFPRLLKCWDKVVGSAIASHTQPLSIQRNVLRVATSSAAWAQNLTFERQRLLVKLNEKLPDPLVDIHFSTAGWKRPQERANQQKTLLPCEHPSYLGDEIGLMCEVLPTKNANAAFENWKSLMQRRSHNLPICPQCQSPTPPGEIQRWGVCSICATKQFSSF
jgi:predicted nucleic acid-binding Zn ribbon protein